MSLNRRDFLKQVAAASALTAPALLGLPSWSSTLAAPDLPTPDFSLSNILGYVAGLRPMRTSGVRLEIETLANKTVIHNYGHGGSGFTLAWGSAEEAANLLASTLPTSNSVAVLGAGVIGLTTARVLVDRGYKVKMYYGEISPNTTSDVAGAQWSPSFVSSGATRDEQARYERMLAMTYRRFETLAGSTYGVFLRPNYIPNGIHDGIQDVAKGVMKPAQRLARLPFARVKSSGTVMQSWLIEPSVFLPMLINELKSAGVQFEQKKFATLSEIHALAAPVIVNCCGLGARTLFHDTTVIPIKGQLVLLKPKAGMHYLALHKGYVFCRRDAIVLGGSYEKNVFDTKIVPAVSDEILRINRQFFRV